MLCFENLVQVLALNVRHGNELHAVGFAQVVNAQNISVGNRAGEQQFVLEPQNDLSVGGEF